MMITRLMWRALFLLAACGAGSGAWAQDYPNRPIKIVVPNTPGTNPDLLARLIAPEMSKALGQAVVVENRPGAAQVIGYEYVAKAPPDGYTLIAAISSELAILPLMNRNLRFDPAKDLQPVVGVAAATLVLATSTGKPWKQATELIAHAKAHPGKLNYGSSSPATLLPMLAFIQGFAIDAVSINYKGGVPFVQAVMTGEADIGFMPESYVVAAPDRLRALAAASPQRLPSFPDTPTFAELGGLMIPQQFYSFNVPTGTPAPIIAKLGAAISSVMKQPDLRARIERTNLRIVEQSSEASAQGVAEVSKVFADIARRAGIDPK